MCWKFKKYSVANCISSSEEHIGYRGVADHRFYLRRFKR